MPSSTNYTQETIQLDGEDFDGCEFKKCRLVYSGGAVPTFVDCKFDDCDWRLDGAATNTLGFMKTMWTSGAKAKVQELIKGVTGAGK